MASHVRSPLIRPFIVNYIEMVGPFEQKTADTGFIFAHESCWLSVVDRFGAHVVA